MGALRGGGEADRLWRPETRAPRPGYRPPRASGGLAVAGRRWSFASNVKLG